MMCGGGIVILSMTPARHSTSSSSDEADDHRELIEPRPGVMRRCRIRPMVFIDSSRSVFHRRLVIAPKLSLLDDAAVALARPVASRRRR